MASNMRGATSPRIKLLTVRDEAVLIEGLPPLWPKFYLQPMLSNTSFQLKVSFPMDAALGRCIALRELFYVIMHHVFPTSSATSAFPTVPLPYSTTSTTRDN